VLNANSKVSDLDTVGDKIDKIRSRSIDHPRGNHRPELKSDNIEGLNTIW